jgi:hypothetical protein
VDPQLIAKGAVVKGVPKSTLWQKPFGDSSSGPLDGHRVKGVSLVWKWLEHVVLHAFQVQGQVVDRAGCAMLVKYAGERGGRLALRTGTTASHRGAKATAAAATEGHVCRSAKQGVDSAAASSASEFRHERAISIYAQTVPSMIPLKRSRVWEADGKIGSEVHKKEFAPMDWQLGAADTALVPKEAGHGVVLPCLAVPPVGEIVLVAAQWTRG